MAKDWMATGWKLRMRGYRSMGDSVPLVMTTVWNFWNTGFTARLASRQLSCRTASGFQDIWVLGFQGKPKCQPLVGMTNPILDDSHLVLNQPKQNATGCQLLMPSTQARCLPLSGQRRPSKLYSRQNHS